VIVLSHRQEEEDREQGARRSKRTELVGDNRALLPAEVATATKTQGIWG
jgi:hypothetical protein